MSNQSVEELLAKVDDKRLPELDREQAIHELKNYPEPAVIAHMIQALESDDSGIRWAASSTLIEFGDAALRPLLQALVERRDSVWLREGAYRVFHDTHNYKVQQVAGELVKALKGPAAESTTTDAAVRALRKLDQQVA
jgi:HEAT repeat protein